jgi:hypothetical protein
MCIDLLISTAKCLNMDHAKRNAYISEELNPQRLEAMAKLEIPIIKLNLTAREGYNGPCDGFEFSALL